ncbi:MAG: ABC transporter permease, partial [Acidobacteriota bacterium]
MNERISIAAAPLEAGAGPAGPVPREVGFMAGAKAVFRFSLPVTLVSRRTLMMGLLGTFLPLSAMVFLVVKAIPQAEIRRPGYIFYTGSFQFIFYYVMLVALFYGTAVVAEEIDWKTLTYLLVRPVSKGAILVGKGAAAWTVGSMILLPVITCTYLLFTLADGLMFSGGASSFWINLPTFLGDLLRVAGGLAVYTAVFMFLGAQFKHPVIWAIGVAFGWESWVAFVPGLTRKLTVMHYLQSLSPHAAARSIGIS